MNKILVAFLRNRVGKNHIILKRIFFKFLIKYLVVQMETEIMISKSIIK